MIEILVDRDVGQIPASISDKKKKQNTKKSILVRANSSSQHLFHVKLETIYYQYERLWINYGIVIK